MTRLLGIDLGERRIGLAIADPLAGSLRPAGVVRRGTLDEDAERLARIATEQGAVELIVGLPLNLDGTEGRQARATRDWGEAIAERTQLPVRYRDERLTSETAEVELGRVRRGRSGGAPSAARLSARRASVDARAAALILQAELDARSRIG